MITLPPIEFGVDDLRSKEKPKPTNITLQITDNGFELIDGESGDRYIAARDVGKTGRYHVQNAFGEMIEFSIFTPT